VDITGRDDHPSRVPTGIKTFDVARRLREAREAIEPNASKFAGQAGIAQNAYSQFETGKRLLTLTAAVKLYDRYHLSLDWLYRGDVAFIPTGLSDKLAMAEPPRAKRAGSKKGLR
jgi:transcriptional regulator with XRE-family HTH domain